MDPAMMAQMPPEGIASLPMDQGAMPPMQMARGGIVQHFQLGGGVFQDGFDEGGTPFPMALSSSTRTVSQEMRDMADDELREYAQRPPLEVPSLQAAMEGRLPMYEELLGAGKNSDTQAQMLFDIAQAALGYAANVGPQGQPLRGSQAARLAGATQALPGQIGARVADQRKQEQAMRMLALDAAEKDLQSIREANTAQAREQRQLLQTITRSATDSETMAQASLSLGKAWGVVNAMPEKILSGTASPSEIALFETSMAMVTPVKEQTDPLTGAVVTSRPAVPLHAQDAAALINRSRLEGQSLVPSGMGERPVLGRSPEPFDQNVPPPALDPLVIASPRTENYGQPNVASFFNAADSATGIMPVVAAGLFRLPVLNNLARETAGQELQAQTFVTMGTNALVEAFNSNTARFTAEERRDLQEKLRTLPSLFNQPEAYRAGLFALDDLLQIKQESALRNYRNENLDMNLRREYMQAAITINEARLLMGVPLHVDGPRDPRLEQIILRYPVGTSMIVIGDPSTPGVPTIRTVTQEAKDALINRGQ
jgi:hypothetical protein